MNGNAKHPRLDQRRAPIYEALERFRQCGWCLLMCRATERSRATRS